jgi:hypothetical protein
VLVSQWTSATWVIDESFCNAASTSDGFTGSRSLYSSGVTLLPRIAQMR